MVTAKEIAQRFNISIRTVYRDIRTLEAAGIPIGSEVLGAVCPFAINEGVGLFLDVSLKRFDIIYTAGGSLNSTVKLSLEELETHSVSAE